MYPMSRVLVQCSSHVFSWYTHKPLGECVNQENTSGSTSLSDKWNIPWYTMGEHCILTTLNYDFCTMPYKIQWPTQLMQNMHGMQWEGTAVWV